MKMSRIISTTALVLGLGMASVFGQEGARPARNSAHAASAVPATYPLKKCVVSGEALGEHGKPVKVTTPSGTDVYLCCKDCVDDFKKDPEKYGAMVKHAEGKK
jgi:hypothetical protein